MIIIFFCLAQELSMKQIWLHAFMKKKKDLVSQIGRCFRLVWSNPNVHFLSKPLVNKDMFAFKAFLQNKLHFHD